MTVALAMHQIQLLLGNEAFLEEKLIDLHGTLETVSDGTLKEGY